MPASTKREKDKRESRRVSPEEARAAMGREGGGGRGLAGCFNLPEGVRLWEPESGKTYQLDFLPYEVTAEAHPMKIAKGKLWYTVPFIIFKNVGVQAETIVSPATFGEPCPLYKRWQELATNWDDTEEERAAMSMQRCNAYVIDDPDDADKVAIFATSWGKFGKALKKERDAVGDEAANFFDVVDGCGKTVEVRFQKETFTTKTGPGSYTGAGKINFLDRDDRDEEETLARVPKLDDCFVIHSYETLERMLLGNAEAGAAPNGKEPTATTRSSAPSRTPSGSGSGRTTARASKEPEDYDTPKGIPDDDEPQFAKGDRVKFLNGKGKETEGVIDDIDGDSAVVVDDKQRDYDVKLKDLEPADDTAQEAEDDADPADQDTPPDDAPAFDVGDDCKVKGSKDDYVITKIDGDDITVKDKKTGQKIIVEPDDIIPAAAAQEAAEEFEAGDAVTWDDGDESGTVIEVLNNGTVKVKNKEGKKSIQDPSDLAKKPSAGKAPAAKGGKK